MNKNKNKMILDLFVFLNQILIELFILNSLFIIYSIPFFIQSHRVIIVFVFFCKEKYVQSIHHHHHHQNNECF